MNRSILFSIIGLGLALPCSLLQGQIVLDHVMSKDDQKKTGVANLTYKQKVALEDWLNQNFVPKTKEQAPAPQLALSININSGQKLMLSDNSVWEVDPDDVQTAAIWITPFPVKIAPSYDSDYPFLLINADTGVSVKVRKTLSPLPMQSPPSQGQQMPPAQGQQNPSGS